MKTKTECPLLMYKLLAKIENLSYAYRKPTINTMCTYYHLLKFSKIYTVAHGCFQISSSGTEIRTELLFVTGIFY